MISKQAKAKINLALHITGRKTDGYHLLDSLVVFTTVHDRVTVEPSTTIKLIISGPRHSDLPSTDNENLVMSAAKKLHAFAGLDPETGAIIHLHKHLPVSAGIGGGSADAASALHALNELWKLNFSRPQLAYIGIKLGADVPVCLSASASRVGGIGEQIIAVSNIPPLHLVLVNPYSPMPTADVFRKLESKNNTGLPEIPKTSSFSDWFVWLNNTRNDLYQPALALDPSLKLVEQALNKTKPLLMRMSGSGATFFGLYESQNQSETAANLLRTAKPQWWVRAVETS